MQYYKDIIIEDEYEARIESVCYWFRNRVSEFQVLNWLNNFKKNDWNFALTVLESIKYFTITDIIYEFDESLKKILESYPNDQIFYLHGLGIFGKSGSSLIYYLKQSPSFKKNDHRLKILSHIKKIKQQGITEGSYLILVDDIIGSGKSLIKYYNHNIKQQLYKENFRINTLILCIAFMENSIEFLKGTIDNLNIYGTGYKKAFASGSSVFGYRKKMLPIREFCYKYGYNLFKLFDRDLNEMVHHPLGYNESQSLIVFEHSVPNNTLPIIWSSENGWYPLFPRNSKEKISQSKDFRNQTLHWLNFAYKLNIFKNKFPINNIYFKDINYKILAIIRLKRRGSIDTIICQILGISINEFNEAIAEGIKKNIFDSEHNLSSKGMFIYKELKKKIKFTNTRDKSKKTNLQNQIIYVPRVFLGKT